MTELTSDMQHRIAHRAASAYRRRGVKSYSYDDLYQDSVVVMRHYAGNYNCDKGNLEAYLTKCCLQKLGNICTRAMHPVSARSNNDLVQLKSIKCVQINHRNETDQLDYDHLVWLTQLRERMYEVAGERGRTPLMIALGLTSVAEVSESAHERVRLHQDVRRVKRLLLNDRKLMLMAKELRCLK